MRLSPCSPRPRKRGALHASPFVPGVPGDLGVSLPDVFRIEAVELGDGARLQRSLYLIRIVVD
jgi:hypothetical protein